MKQTATNRIGFSFTGNSIRNKALRVFMILAMSGTSFTYAQQAVTNVPNDMKPVEDQPFYNERNPGSGTPKGNIIVAPICPTITSLTMLDMGFDKAILTWSNIANFDSIYFRFAPTGSLISRIVGISGNPNPERYYLMGLVSQTSYDIEVSTVCSSGGRSAWSAPITVTTLAEPAPRLSNQSNPNMLIVNPNPAASLTTISFAATAGSPQQVSIVSSTGRIVYSRQIIPTSDKVQMSVDVSAYTPGIYMVRVNNNSNVSVERLIKL